MAKRIMVLIALSLSACSSSQPSAPPPAPAEPALTTAAEPAKAAEPVKPAEPAQTAKQATPEEQATVEVKLHVNGNSMKFNVEAITAAPGQPVHVVLTNDKPGALSHNWALVKPGTEASVAAAGLKEGADKGYLPAIPDVLAHTEMIAPGKTTEVTFKAPLEPGKYPYVCTFPGHYLMMKGVLTVTP